MFFKKPQPVKEIKKQEVREAIKIILDNLYDFKIISLNGGDVYHLLNKDSSVEIIYRDPNVFSTITCVKIKVDNFEIKLNKEEIEIILPKIKNIISNYETNLVKNKFKTCC